MTTKTCPKCGGWHGAQIGECQRSYKSSASPACSIAESRVQFERWITSPPFERDVTRRPNDLERVAWPGMYESYEVELAWEAWQAARQ